MTVVVVLAKAPVAGRVKTRLCPPLTHDQAADVASASLADTFVAAFAAAQASRVVAVVDGDPMGWVPDGVQVFPQVEGGLDRRLAAAFATMCTEFGEPVVLIAMDTPHVTGPQLDDAIATLRTRDAVLGLAADGGFWIIGLKPPVGCGPTFADIFHDVPMSTSTTGAEQQARLLRYGFVVGDVPMLRDIDDVEDIAAVANEHPHLQLAACWRQLDYNGQQ